MNHGQIKLAKPVEIPRIAIPPHLRNKTIYSGLPEDEAIQRSGGVFSMVALRDVMVKGENVQQGDSFKADGFSCVELALMRAARFDDPRLEEETRILDAAEKIKNSPPAPDASRETIPHPRSRQSFVADTFAPTA